MNTQPCDKLWAILSVDRKGNEGICQLNLPIVGPTVAITGSFKILQVYKDFIKTEQSLKEAMAQDVTMRIGEFTRTGNLEL